MEQGRSEKRSGKIGIIWAASLVVTAVAVFFASSYFLGSMPGKSGDKQTLIREMRFNLVRASEQEKCAVMSATDEDAQSFADQSRTASDSIERDRNVLSREIERSGSDNERTLLNRFNAAWASLRQTDTKLLESAGQNTNLKAVELSRTICDELLQKLHEDLSKLTQKVTPPARRNEMDKIAGAAENAALKIALLQLRHIDASSPAEKKTIESSIRTESQKAISALKTLDSMTGRKSATFINSATNGFGQFMQVNDEILRLSNINSNKTTVEISLGARRMAEAECDNLLKKLLTAAGKGSK